MVKPRLITTFNELQHHLKEHEDVWISGVRLYNYPFTLALWSEFLCGMVYKKGVYGPRFEYLDLGCCGLNDLDVAQLCRSLPLNVRHLLLGGNVIESGNAIAAYLKQNRKLESLNLRYNLLGPRAVAEIAKSVALHPSLESINLGGNGIEDAGVKALCYALVMSKTICKLSLFGNELQFCAKYISEVIDYCSSLRYLDLWSNQLGSIGATMIGRVLAKDHVSLEVLNLGNNEIGNEGAVSIAEVLRTNQRLINLNLGKNGIDDDGAYILASALMLNRTLQVIDLSENHLTKKSCQVFIKSVYNHESLRFVNFDQNYLSKEDCDDLYNMASHFQSSVRFLLKEYKATENPNEEFRETEKIQESELLEDEFFESTNFGETIEEAIDHGIDRKLNHDMKHQTKVDYPVLDAPNEREILVSESEIYPTKKSIVKKQPTERSFQQPTKEENLSYPQENEEPNEFSRYLSKITQMKEIAGSKSGSRLLTSFRQRRQDAIQAKSPKRSSASPTAADGSGFMGLLKKGGFLSDQKQDGDQSFRREDLSLDEIINTKHHQTNPKHHQTNPKHHQTNPKHHQSHSKNHQNDQSLSQHKSSSISSDSKHSSEKVKTEHSNHGLSKTILDLIKQQDPPTLGPDSHKLRPAAVRTRSESNFSSPMEVRSVEVADDRSADGLNTPQTPQSQLNFSLPIGKSPRKHRHSVMSVSTDASSHVNSGVFKAKSIQTVDYTKKKIILDISKSEITVKQKQLLGKPKFLLKIRVDEQLRMHVRGSSVEITCSNQTKPITLTLDSEEQTKFLSLVNQNRLRLIQKLRTPDSSVVSSRM